MSFDAEHLEALVSQLMKADPKDWGRLCGEANCDEATRELACRRAQAFSALPPDVPVGDELAGQCHKSFKFVRRLGAGGFGEVWLARDQNIKRWVAVKFLHSRDAEHRDQLLREAQASAFEHSHVVTMHQVEYFDALKKSAIIMQLCADAHVADQEREPVAAELAEPLPKRPRPKRLNYRQIATDMLTIASAVAAAHRRNVIHADLKPENILVTPGGKLFVTDFGLGRAGSVQDANHGPLGTASITVVSSNRQIRGTPCYMSPEQARGEQPIKRSDVYSLGGTLYFLLNGEPPHVGSSNLSIIEAVAAGSRKPTSPQGPRGLAKICRRAMTFDEAGRFEDAGQLAVALQRWLWFDSLRRITQAAAAVFVLVLIVLGAVQLSARHLEFRGGPTDAVFVQRGHPLLPTWGVDSPVYDTGLTAPDVTPSERSALLQRTHWMWNRPEAKGLRDVGVHLRPAVALRWRAYCGDWKAAADLNRRAWSNDLLESETSATQEAWKNLLPLAPEDTVSVVINLLDSKGTGQPPNELLKLNAIESLGIVGKHDSETAINKLKEVFGQEQAHSLRWAAILAVGDIGSHTPHHALPFLLEVAQGEDADFHGAAGMALNTIAKAAPTEVAREVAPWLKSTNPDCIGLALVALADIERATDDQLLTDVLRIAASDNPDIGVPALDLLGAIGAPRQDEVVAVVRSQLSAPQPQIQQAALRALEKRGGPAVTDCWTELLALLDGSDDETALAVVDTIVLSRVDWDPAFTQVVLDWLHQSHSSRRTAKAAWAAGSAPASQVSAFVKPLINLLAFHDQDNPFRSNPLYRAVNGRTRSDAARSLGELANKVPEVVVPNIVDALADKNDPKKREGAVQVFQYLNLKVAGEAQAVARCGAIINDANEVYFVRQHALLALHAIGKADAVQSAQHLAPQLSNGDDRFSVDAALALGALGPPGFDVSQSSLATLSKAAESKTRRAVAIACAQFAHHEVTHDELGAIANGLLQDGVDVVREDARNALGEWLWMTAKRQRDLRAAFTELMTELRSDRSRLQAEYRAGVVRALGLCLQAFSAPGASAADLAQCRAELAAIRDKAEHLWLRAAAFDVSESDLPGE